jgi:membrane protease YdiL (CAAX protease family)
MGPASKLAVVVIWSAVLAFLIEAFGQGVWGALLVGNLATTPAIPWAAPAMALVLWLMWQYLGGRWWPRSTSETRRSYLRARRVPGRVFAWTLVAGALSIVALTGYWIVMFQLFKMSANVLPDISKYPKLTIAVVFVIASLVSPLTEEAAFRGYCQTILEKNFRGPAAIVISSILFALAHLTQGFFPAKLFVYFLAGLVFGVPAYFSKSTLPSLPVHILADMTFFTLIWPHDAARRLVWQGGADAWFWVHSAQAIVFTGLAIVAYGKLASVAGAARTAESAAQ